MEEPGYTCTSVDKNSISEIVTPDTVVFLSSQSKCIKESDAAHIAAVAGTVTGSVVGALILLYFSGMYSI